MKTRRIPGKDPNKRRVGTRVTRREPVKNIHSEAEILLQEFRQLSQALMKFTMQPKKINRNKELAVVTEIDAAEAQLEQFVERRNELMTKLDQRTNVEATYKILRQFDAFVNGARANIRTLRAIRGK